MFQPRRLAPSAGTLLTAFLASLIASAVLAAFGIHFSESGIWSDSNSVPGGLATWAIL